MEPGTAGLFVMGLFKADFYRMFALGFVGGALIVFGAMNDSKPGLGESLVPAAQAAQAATE